MNLVSARCDDAAAAAQCSKPASIWLRPTGSPIGEASARAFSIISPWPYPRPATVICQSRSRCEVTASCLLEIGYDERVLSGAGDIER
jgi:hypothetical protein